MDQTPNSVPRRNHPVRPIRDSDLEEVIAIDGEITGLAKPAYWRDLFERYHERDGRQRYFLVAESDGTVRGFIIGEVRAWEFGSPPCGWVFAIGVRASLRQDGIGRILFDSICDRFRRAGVGTVRTMLARDDTLVMSFFRAQGMMAGPFVQLDKDL
jgi:ribosomal protein S18 acetylase RimI-like enzyme